MSEHDFETALSNTTQTLDACVVVGGSLLVLNYDNLIQAISRGVRVRLLFPDPHAEWLSTMIDATTSGRQEYVRRITTNAARARALGPAVEIRWYAASVTAWFAILDASVVAHKAISFATLAKPAVTMAPTVLSYHSRLFETLWASAERSMPEVPSAVRRPTRARGLYFSYADKDTEHFEALHAHLAPSLRTRSIVSWHRGVVSIGAVYLSEVARRIEEACVTILLVSAHWLSSSICQEEFRRAMELSERGRMRIFPVLVRPCRFEDSSPLAELAMVPRSGTAITLWVDPDSAWTHVANEVFLLEELK